MATQPNKWTIQIGYNANTTTIPVTAGADKIDLSKLYPSAYELPLDAGGEAVDRTEMNTLFSMLFENVYFQQQGGIYIYDASIDYTVGTRVLFNDDLFKCIQANGISTTVKDPTNTDYWDRLVVVSDLDPLYKLFPTGGILPFGGTVAPNGFLLCNGLAYSRTSYANLFAVIGTRFGAGDGSTTFNVPNFMNGSFVRGVVAGSVGTEYSASLPPLTATTAGNHTHTRGTMNITGSVALEDCAIQGTGGAFYHYGNASYGVGGIPTYRPDDFSFDASRSWTGATSPNGEHTHTITTSSSVAMNGNTVLPQSVGTAFIIKI